MDEQNTQQEEQIQPQTVQPEVNLPSDPAAAPVAPEATPEVQPDSTQA